MELTVEQLLQGKATKIKEKEFFTTKAYVEPFFDRMSKYTEEFIINVKPADQISLTPSGEVNFDDIVYNRVWNRRFVGGGVPDAPRVGRHRPGGL